MSQTGLSGFSDLGTTGAASAFELGPLEIANDLMARPPSDAGDAKPRVVAVVGLTFEARIAAGTGVAVICRGPEHEIAASIDQAIMRGCRSVVSFGVAGGLAPHLKPGDCVIASSVVDHQGVYATHRGWSDNILNKIGEAEHLPILGVDAPVSDPTAKRRLHADTGAAVVDMESHTVARLAAARGLEFAAIRIVIDPSHRRVPSAAIAGMRSDGRTDIAAIVRNLAGRPSQLGGMLRLAADAHVARRKLTRLRRQLGTDFGLHSTSSIPEAHHEAAFARTQAVRA